MHRSLLASATLLVALAATGVARSRPPAVADVVFTGRVLSSATAAPVGGARVALRDTRRATTAGADGVYRLAVPRAEITGSTATLVVTRTGYERAEETVRADGDLVRRDLLLAPESTQLDGLVATEQASAPAARSRMAVMTPGFAPPMAPPPPGGWNTEQYAHIRESGFVAVASDTLSTFSIDVDRASYSNVRRFIREGNAPPADAVRVEEMVNYFTYAYPEPRRGEPFSVTTEIARAPWEPRHHLLRVGLRSRSVETENLPASNLVFLIDVSGSMQSPDKLPLVKQSLRMLVNELRPRDRVAIVVYAGAAGLVLPSTPGDEKTRILAAIEELEAGGSTAGGAGLRLAYDVARDHHLARGNNRVILATDGDFNVGVSSDAEMVRLVENRREQGTFLTVLGFGTGNLQDAKMEQMADHGNGNYAYIDSQLEARKVLVQEMGGTLLTVAKDVKVQVEFNPARVRAYRLIGYENRALADHEFNDDTRDAGELGAGHAVTALYEVVPVGATSDVRIGGTDDLRYQAPARPSGVARGEELAFVKIRYKEPTGSESRLLQHAVPEGVREPSADLRFAAAVAGFGMILRDSPHRGELGVAEVLELARGGRGPDAEGYRADFISLVERYRRVERGEEMPPTD